MTFDANGFIHLAIPSLRSTLSWAFYSHWLGEPGDSIRITVDGTDLIFSGKGADKYTLQYEIRSIRKKMKPPTPEPIVKNPLKFQEYFEWMDWLDNYEEQFTTLINSYKGRVSTAMLNRIRDESADFAIQSLKDLFSHLLRIAKESNYTTITKDDICAIYDSTVAGKIEKQFPYLTDGFLGEWTFLETKFEREHQFQYENGPLNSRLNYLLFLYEEGLKLYKDQPLTREQFLVDLFTEGMLEDVSYSPEIKNLLDKYYAEPGYPAFKQYIREQEFNRKRVRRGFMAPAFELTDSNGEIYSSDNLKGKMVLIDFWKPGCDECISMTPALKKIKNEFKGDTNIVFLSVSTDKDRANTSGAGIKLYPKTKSIEDYILKAFLIDSYPTLYLLDHKYTIIENPIPDPRLDNGEYLINLIHRKRALMEDGPYIMYKNNSRIAYSIISSSVVTNELAGKNAGAFTVRTDLNRTFTVRLKQKLQVEPAEFAKPGKLLALSDIEGNFDALRKLLQSNGVMDENYNWIFGNGHVVFNGDIFDRGLQVTECLWLIYSLEEKAKVAGGYVHFILGNHEIMNLNGNHDYVTHKYQENAALLGKKYGELFSVESELGRWLRTKNIMEKIGNLLFVHGGISSEMNDLPLSITQVNELARPYYDKDSLASRSGDPALALLYGANNKSPFWYRLYYQGAEAKASAEQVDRTLKKYQVDHIVTGHTLIKPQYNLSVHYQGKVVNIDTRHAAGISEALLVEGNHYYKINARREKLLLFSDEKK